MKESEFIALLNVYLDHEISAADAARLEAEVQSNPARRRVYQQYCRMQKACKVLAADFQSEAEAADNARDKKVVAFSSAAPRRKSANFYTVGTFVAAAACVAIIFVGRARQQANQAAVRAENAAAHAAPAAAAVDVTPALAYAGTSAPRGLVSITTTAQNGRAQTTLVGNPLLLTDTSQSTAVLVNSVQPTVGADQLAWLTRVQLAPLPQHLSAEDLRFDVHPTSLRPEGRALGGRATNSNGAVEMSAFNFNK